MTQARTHTRVVGGSPLIQLLLEAVLCAFVSLVQGVATTLGMRRQSKARDWHTHLEESALPQAKPDTSQEGRQLSQPSFSGKAEGRIPRTPVGSTRGQASNPRSAPNRDSRHKAENDSVDVVTTNATLSPSFRAKARSAADPEPRGDTRRHHAQLLGSGSRVPRVRNDSAGVFNRGALTA